jgi:hypothetical protein
MATNFPTSLDTFTNPNSGNTLDSPSHSIQHSDINDAVEAIEAKIGVGSSTAGSATAGYALVNTSGGTTAYSLLGVSGLSSGTAVANTFLRANGSGAATFAPTAQGLTLINTTTFTAQSSVSLPDNTFTSTYKNYRVIYRSTQNTSTGVLTMRMRTAGTDLSSANYSNGGIESGITENNTRINATGNTSWGVFTLTAGNIATIVFDLISPQVAEQTLGFYNAFATNKGDNRIVAVQIGLSNQFDSMSFITSAGTITGAVEAYGYNV